MKKIPTLFTRVYEKHKIVGIQPEITPGCEEAFLNGEATIKVDGACCAIIDGALYKRYDAKKGKRPPAGAIPCCDPDPITGHWPHWVKVDETNPDDKWFWSAFTKLNFLECNDVVTYEAVGPHFNGNPYNLEEDMLIQHGTSVVDVRRDFESIKSYLESNTIEGIVFWLNGEPICKIKRTDFGFKWPVR
jgi:hypothetical protein